jgi:TPR repeat protein
MRPGSTLLNFISVLTGSRGDMKRLMLPLLLALCASAAQTAEKTIRICDETGCSDRPQSTSSFDPNRDSRPEETKRLQALADMANQNPLAAFDLSLRYFRGDGVPRDSYLGLRWMREAGQHGYLPAQVALGRIYLAGLDEMGPDSIEAESWLSLAAQRGSIEARELLLEAQTAKNSEQALYRSREVARKSRFDWLATPYRCSMLRGSAAWYCR